MHLVIDILAGMVLLFFFLGGWHKGFMLSLLGIVRSALAYLSAYLAGRYLGVWLANTFHRPRFVTIPLCAIVAFAVVAFVFRVVMYELREKRREQEKKEDYRHPLPSCLSGGIVNLASGAVALVVAFWALDVFAAVVAGTGIPGSQQSLFARAARRIVYETACAAIPKRGREQQVSAMARMASNPAEAIRTAEAVLRADSIRQLAADPAFWQAFFGGDAERIRANASARALLDDRETLDRLARLGVLSGRETQTDLAGGMAQAGRALNAKLSDEQVQLRIQALKNEQLLSAEKLPQLVRDNRFLYIVDTVLK